MKKAKSLLALSGAVVVMLGLASCDVTASADGNKIITIGNQVVTADEALDTYLKTKDGVRAVYDLVNNSVARNLMFKNSAYSSKKDELVAKATTSVDDIKEQARKNADTNKTSYDDELETLLKNNGAKDLEQLQVNLENKNFVTYLQDRFYDDNLANLRNGSPISVGDDTIDVESFLVNTVPYHVKHILVKVSASASDYVTSTITESEANRLSTVLNTLGFNTAQDFGAKAVGYSDDTGSKETFGDLGIMSINTSYVNEFKLGVYAYDALWNGSVKDTEENNEKTANFRLSENPEVEEYLKNKGVNFIPSNIADILSVYAKDTKDAEYSPVNSGKERYYPRNIVWNNYLNKHEVSFVEFGTEIDLNTIDPVDGTAAIKTKVEGTDYTLAVHPEAPTGSTTKWVSAKTTDGSFVLTNYVQVGMKNTAGVIENHLVLTDGDPINPKPILATRAGTGEGESGYQGIHFIAVQRGALDTDQTFDSTLDEYYSTKTPDKDGTIDGKILYVNAFEDTDKVYQSRITSLKSEIKNADPTISHKINQYYFKLSGASYVDQKLENAIAQYVDAEIVSTTSTKDKEMDDKWNEYLKLLERQQDEQESEKMIPMVCAVSFKTGMSGAEFQAGGKCYDPESI